MTTSALEDSTHFGILCLNYSSTWLPARKTRTTRRFQNYLNTFSQSMRKPSKRSQTGFPKRNERALGKRIGIRLQSCYAVQMP